MESDPEWNQNNYTYTCIIWIYQVKVLLLQTTKLVNLNTRLGWHGDTTNWSWWWWHRWLTGHHGTWHLMTAVVTRIVSWVSLSSSSLVFFFFFFFPCLLLRLASSKREAVDSNRSRICLLSLPYFPSHTLEQSTGVNKQWGFDTFDTMMTVWWLKNPRLISIQEILWKEVHSFSPLESLQLGSSGSLKDRTKKDGERMEGGDFWKEREGERKNRRENQESERVFPLLLG